MRNRMMVLVVAGLAGCSAEPDAPTELARPSETASEQAASSPLPAAPPEQRWTVERAMSQIDGEMVVASRAYEFPDYDALLVVNLTCSVSSGDVDLVLQSVVGDEDAPSQESALLTDATGQAITEYSAQLSMYPKGRIKVGDRPAEQLASYFRVDETYSNYARYGLTNPLTTSLVDAAIGSKVGLDVFPKGAVNRAKVIRASLPMVLEVANGAAQFELTIDASPEAVTTLEACGSDGALLSEDYEGWIRQQIEAGEL